MKLSRCAAFDFCPSPINGMGTGCFERLSGNIFFHHLLSGQQKTDVRADPVHSFPLGPPPGLALLEPCEHPLPYASGSEVLFTVP